MTDKTKDTHFLDFVDFPPPKVIPEDKKMCPKCQGYGGYNIQTNAYPLRDKENTPENRHLYAHFRGCCSNCVGHGYIDKDQNCVHEWGNKTNVGNCLNKYTCSKCKETWTVDSSD